MSYIDLASLSPDKAGIVRGFSKNTIIKRRLQDLGFTEGTIVKCAFVSPLGDPKAFYVKGTVIALRAQESSNIVIEKITEGGTWD